MVARYPVFDTDFIVGKDGFEDIKVTPTAESNFYWFYNSSSQKLIKQFVLQEREQVDYLCQVTLVKRGDRFSPRLRFFVRHRRNPRATVVRYAPATEDTVKLKAAVDMKDCHENFWALISYLKYMQELDVPDESFSLIKKTEHELVEAFSKVGAERRKTIIKLASQGVEFTEQDINEMLHRKKRLQQFEDAFAAQGRDEHWWQKFFERNKWIFGYGLNYVILRLERSQASVGGASIDRTGDKISDYLASTLGLVGFTVLVEIKTPQAALISGSKPIRSGAWRLGTDLTDALSQIHANIEEWTLRGSSHPSNVEKLKGIYTVKPKGIVVVGSLAQVRDDRTKRETFELFRKSVHGVDIITFDELLERAPFIVDRQT
jgi:hypothetical protein